MKKKFDNTEQSTAATDHHPASSEKYDDSKYVDHAWCKHAVPSTKQDRLWNEEVSFPPRLAVSRLQTIVKMINTAKYE